jgi:hypothetical protein
LDRTGVKYWEKGALELADVTLGKSSNFSEPQRSDWSTGMHGLLLIKLW